VITFGIVTLMKCQGLSAFMHVSVQNMNTVCVYGIKGSIALTTRLLLRLIRVCFVFAFQITQIWYFLNGPEEA